MHVPERTATGAAATPADVRGPPQTAERRRGPVGRGTGPADYPGPPGRLPVRGCPDGAHRARFRTHIPDGVPAG